MYILKNKIWLFCVLIFGLHQVSQKILCWNFDFFDSYLDPFLFIPILLGLVLQERILITNRFFNNFSSTSYHFSLFEIFVITAFFAILFEEGISRWVPNFTKDYWDYIAYFSGAIIFHFFINTPKI